MTTELFSSSARIHGLSGVFEYDGETSYFYLVDHSKEHRGAIVDAIHVTSSPPDFRQVEIRICWDRQQNLIGLFLHGELWAAFNTRGEKFGGDYRPGTKPQIPAEISSSF